MEVEVSDGWFIAANVEPKTLILLQLAPIAVHPCTPSVSDTKEASVNTTNGWKANASVSQTAEL